MSFVHVPSALRRSGHQLTPGSTIVQQRGFCGLTTQQAHTLRESVADIKACWPNRMLAELLVDLAEKRADLPTTLAVLEEWRRRVPTVRAVDGDRFPPRVLREVVQ
jgi:hypothetical protein